MDVRTVNWWIMHFSSGDREVREKVSRLRCRFSPVQHAGGNTWLLIGLCGKTLLSS